MVTQTLTCRHCGSTDMTRFGFTQAGRPRLRCHACHRTSVAAPAPPRNGPQRRGEILAACQERCSMRGVARVFHVSRNTLSGWLKKSPGDAPAEGGAP